MRTLLTLLLTCAPLVLAHDMWMEPTTFTPRPGEIVGVKLRVGQDLLGDPLPRASSLIREFSFHDRSGRNPVIGREGADPAGMLRIAEPGLVIVSYSSNANFTETAPEKFNQFLKEEGLERIPEASTKVREVFFRCAKSLIVAGSPAGHDRQLGLTLELIAESTPAEGSKLPIRLLYEKRPLAGALVVALNRQNPARRVTARTDAEGRVRLPLQSAGMWMIKAVHMTPAPAESGAQWASYWASLTFEIQ